jgi:hypothetical protein
MPCGEPPDDPPPVTGARGAAATRETNPRPVRAVVLPRDAPRYCGTKTVSASEWLLSSAPSMWSLMKSSSLTQVVKPKGL